MWTDAVLALMQARCESHVINDSKTPSGRVHVGSLRGVIIHDAIQRLAQQRNMEAKFLYGVDDFDPMDGLPHNADESLLAYMGQPLFTVPSPDPAYTDFADFYIQEFLSIFTELKVEANVYRMRDIYQSGQFDEAMLRILESVDSVRSVYAEFSKHKDSLENWYPVQIICDNCGKIATTKATHFDGKELTYRCEEEQVSWARGCGFTGKKSPFSGGAKLPWKIEWIAKWQTFGVTLEGAGKDHCTKGGSRDVANKCFRTIFEKEPPINVPYEFFLMQGVKMSSSKGVGFYARDMANFLPAEVLRFLMVRQQAKKTVNFSVDADYVTKLFNEHDKLTSRIIDGSANESEQDMFTASQTQPHAKELPAFQLITALAKMPHMNVERVILDRHAQDGDDEFMTQVQQRIASARYWLDAFAREEDLMAVQMQLPESVFGLTIEQRAFLHHLAQVLQTTAIQSESAHAPDLYQRLLFDVARLIPIAPKDAFYAFYCALFDKQAGPKGGSLIAYLGPNFISQRLKDVPHTRLTFWRKTAVSFEQIAEFMDTHAETVQKVSARIIPHDIISQETACRLTMYLAQFSIFLTGGIIHMRRAFIGDFDQTAQEINSIQDQVQVFLAELQQKHQCATDISVKDTE